MESGIKWINRNKELREDEIRYVEDSLGVKFPKDYIDCIKSNDGAYPVPDTFIVQTNEGTLNNLLSLHKDNVDFLLQVHEDVKDRIEGGIIPFARDPFGNLLCFDYRKSEQPVIVFWDHERAYMSREDAISFICSTFTGLLNRLFEAEED